MMKRKVLLDSGQWYTMKVSRLPSTMLSISRFQNMNLMEEEIINHSVAKLLLVGITTSKMVRKVAIEPQKKVILLKLMIVLRCVVLFNLNLWI